MPLQRGRAAARITENRPDTEVQYRDPDETKRPNHLDFIRQLCCLRCGTPSTPDRRTQPGHIRLGNYAGGNTKPDDKNTVPLCADCHTLGGRKAQHTRGERTFWQSDLGIDPMGVAAKLFAVSGDVEQGQRIVFAAWQRSQLHQRQQAAMTAAKDCPVCGGDCAAANPPVSFCPMREAGVLRP